MSSETSPTYEYYPYEGQFRQEPLIIDVPASEPPEKRPFPPRSKRRRVWLPFTLFVLTCLSTLLTGGWIYAVPLMTILVFHEAGHWLQARRYGVRASFPYFIPMPFTPVGTMGAVIGMGSNMSDRRALFDIGITGPLAGLVPTILFCIMGLQWSEITTLPSSGGAGLLLGEPLLFKWLARLTLGPLQEGQDIMLHPMAFAGWVGMLITALNLLPIGQLDGGHVLYGLLRKKAHVVATFLLFGAMVAVFIFEFWAWSLMILLLALMGPKHPPTANDYVSLGWGRVALGWLALAFVPLGFTPMPFRFLAG